MYVKYMTALNSFCVPGSASLPVNRRLRLICDMILRLTYYWLQTSAGILVAVSLADCWPSMINSQSLSGKCRFIETCSLLICEIYFGNTYMRIKFTFSSKSIFLIPSITGQNTLDVITGCGLKRPRSLLR